MKPTYKYIVTTFDFHQGDVKTECADIAEVLAYAAANDRDLNSAASAAISSLQPGCMLAVEPGFDVACEEVWPRRALMYSLWSTGEDKCPCFLVAYETVEAMVANHPLPEFSRDTLLTLSVGDQISRTSPGAEHYFTVRYGMLIDPSVLHPSMADVASKVLYHLRVYRKDFDDDLVLDADRFKYACLNALSIFGQVQRWVQQNTVFLPLDPKGPTTWRTWCEELGYLIHDGISAQGLDEAIADLASNLGVTVPCECRTCRVKSQDQVTNHG